MKTDAARPRSPALADWLVPLGLVLATCVAFAPALQAGFVNWDDERLLLGHEQWRGLGLSHLRWMWTATPLGHWAPLTWLSFGVDYTLWGMNPLGYHLTNVLLHAAAAVAFYFVAHHLLRLALPAENPGTLVLGAGVAALFFAIHPLRVESVAWVTERRDVLSGFLLILTVLAYLRAATTSGRLRRRWFLATLVCFVLAVLAKTISMTLPVVLVVLDIYPLRRLGGSVRTWWSVAARRVWLEKLPFVALAVIAAGLALYGQRSIVAPLLGWSAASRIEVAAYGVWFYLWKTVIPHPISPLYEIDSLLRPRGLAAALAGGAVLAMTIWAFVFRRRWPAVLAALVAYAVFLGPVSGLTQAGPQNVAARYSYLSCLGFAVLAGAGAVFLWRRWPAAPVRGALAGAGAAYFIALGVLTWNGTKAWHDSGTLWARVLALDPTSPVAHVNYGSHLITIGDLDGGEAHVRRSIELRPDYDDALRNLGILAAVHGRLDDSTRTAVGFKLMQLRGPDDLLRAADVFKRMTEDNPNDAVAHNNLGVVYHLAAEYAAAIVQFERAVELDPAYEEARVNLQVARESR